MPSSDLDPGSPTPESSPAPWPAMRRGMLLGRFPGRTGNVRSLLLSSSLGQQPSVVASNGAASSPRVVQQSITLKDGPETYTRSLTRQLEDIPAWNHQFQAHRVQTEQDMLDLCTKAKRDIFGLSVVRKDRMSKSRTEAYAELFEIRAKIQQDMVEVRAKGMSHTLEVCAQAEKEMLKACVEAENNMLDLCDEAEYEMLEASVRAQQDVQTFCAQAENNIHDLRIGAMQDIDGVCAEAEQAMVKLSAEEKEVVRELCARAEQDMRTLCGQETQSMRNLCAQVKREIQKLCDQEEQATRKLRAYEEQSVRELTAQAVQDIRKICAQAEQDQREHDTRVQTSWGQDQTSADRVHGQVHTELTDTVEPSALATSQPKKTPVLPKESSKNSQLPSQDTNVKQASPWTAAGADYNDSWL